ncbi:hypothetical protein [Actinophytocola xanthii]|uniref:hypothetical protein n=1 Tax=Actinophytocola xanthii TaxID=1912961 RepID=UPI0011775190|nr:hypothetical protein [Actinophytocola xanthii]
MVGQLDLDHVTGVTGLSLVECALPDGITCRHARLREMTLDRSMAATLHAEGLRVEGDLFLRSATLRGAGEGGAVRLLGALIGGQLDLGDSEVLNTTGPALHADGLRMEGDLFLRSATLRGAGESGAVRLLGALIGGQLDLEGSEITNATDPAFAADGLRVEGDLFLRNAVLQGTDGGGAVRLLGALIGGQLDLEGSEITNATDPAFAADGLRVEGDLFLRNAVLQGTDGGGAVRLLGALIGGQLDLGGSEITNATGPAFAADGLRVEGSLFLRNAALRGAGESGAVRLLGARIGGQLGLEGGEITNITGPALRADSLRVERGLFLRNAALAGAGESGAVRLLGAQVGGQLGLEGGEITNITGPGLHADALRVDGDLFLRNAALRGAGESGAVRLVGARIGGQLGLEGGEITNITGPALRADSLRVERGLFLRNAALAGAGESGAVRLLGAQVGGQLGLEGGEITNITGPALRADSLRVERGLFLRNAALAGAGESGAVRLLGAQVGGQLGLEGGEITNITGPGLHADALRVDGDLFLRNAALRGAGESGAVRLVGAQIHSQANFTGTQLSNDSGPLLALFEARVDAALILPASVVCPLGSTEITRRGCPHRGRQLVVRGLVFADLGHVSWRQWLHLVVHHTPEYWPQPYQQLAAVERAAGHDNNARHVLIVQQEDLRRRTPEALGGRIGQWRHWLWGWLGRYGYRAHRLVIALAVILTLAGGLGYAAGQVPTRPGHHAAERVPPPTANTAARGTPCSTAELIGLGIDRGLPLGTTGLRTRCDLDTGTRWGQAFTFALWALQALIWALATLAVAAYTGLVRKPT